MAKKTSRGTRVTSYTLASYTSTVPKGGFLSADLAGLPTKAVWPGHLKPSKACRTKGVLGLYSGRK